MQTALDAAISVEWTVLVISLVLRLLAFKKVFRATKDMACR